MITSVVLTIGFAVLSISSFVPTHETGLFGAILILYALVLDLALMPALLMTADALENRYAATFPARTKSGSGASEKTAMKRKESLSGS
jgi:hypothetical protein